MSRAASIHGKQVSKDQIQQTPREKHKYHTSQKKGEKQTVVKTDHRINPSY